MNKVLSWLLVLICCIGIYYLSNMNTGRSNSLSKDLIEKTITEKDKIINHKKVNSNQKKQLVNRLNIPIRKSAHVAEYFLLVILLLNALYITFSKKKGIVLISIIISILFACFDEYHQTFIIGRTGSIKDIGIDCIGIIIGVFFYQLYRRKEMEDVKRRECN